MVPDVEADGALALRAHGRAAAAQGPARQGHAAFLHATLARIAASYPSGKETLPTAATITPAGAGTNPCLTCLPSIAAMLMVGILVLTSAGPGMPSQRCLRR